MQSQQIPDIPKIELDDEGYPTDECLEAIREFRLGIYGSRLNWNDVAYEIFSDAKANWWPDDSLATVEDASCDLFGTHIKRFTFRTGGWSGNESIITAIKRNLLMWNLYWVKSERGGRYTFEVPVGETDGN